MSISSASDSSWSRPSSSEGDNPSSKGVRKRSNASTSRQRTWEQNMARSVRHGTFGVVGSAAHLSWVPMATVEEYSWGGNADSMLRIRREASQEDQRSRRVEIDLLDLVKVVCVRTEEESGAVKEYFAVMRLDRTQPEVLIRRVTTPLGGQEGLASNQEGLASSFGDASAVVDLLNAAAERSDAASALAFLQSLHSLANDDQLVGRAVGQLEELAATMSHT